MRFYVTVLAVRFSEDQMQVSAEYCVPECAIWYQNAKL